MMEIESDEEEVQNPPQQQKIKGELEVPRGLRVNWVAGVNSQSLRKTAEDNGHIWFFNRTTTTVSENQAND